MTIDLKKFTENKEVTVPIVKNWGRIGTRKIQIPSVEDAWYRVLLADRVKIMRKATPLEIDEALETKKKISGYPLGDEIVPLNFKNLFRLGHGETVGVHFLDQPAWEITKVVKWSDDRFYYAGVDYKTNRSRFSAVHNRFDDEGTLEGLRGITPEIRYYFLLLSLQRQSLREFKELERLKLSEAEREKRIKEFQSTFSGRLQKTIEDTGATLVRFYKQGANRYLIHWKVGKQLVKTVIRDNFQIYSAGFCLSGEDRKHSLASLITLAKTFQDDNPLYLTRE